MGQRKGHGGGWQCTWWRGPPSLSGQLQHTYHGTPEPEFESSIQGTQIPAPGGSPGQTPQALKAENLLSAPSSRPSSTLTHGRHWLVTSPLPASVSLSGARGSPLSWSPGLLRGAREIPGIYENGG